MRGAWLLMIFKVIHKSLKRSLCASVYCVEWCFCTFNYASYSLRYVIWAKGINTNYELCHTTSQLTQTMNYVIFTKPRIIWVWLHFYFYLALNDLRNGNKGAETWKCCVYYLWKIKCVMKYSQGTTVVKCSQMVLLDCQGKIWNHGSFPSTSSKYMWGLCSQDYSVCLEIQDQS